MRNSLSGVALFIPRDRQLQMAIPFETLSSPAKFLSLLMVNFLGFSLLRRP